MSFPAGYSDPNNKNQYGSAFSAPQPAYPPPPGPPQQYGGPPPQYGGPPQQYGGPPPQYGVQPQHTAPMVTVNHQQLAAAHGTFALVMDPNSPSGNEHPVRMKCPSCQAEITTTTTYEIGSCTWVWCIMLAAMGCWLCCFLVFLMDCTKDVVHSCPNCRAVCGKFVRQQGGGGTRVKGGVRSRRR